MNRILATGRNLEAWKARLADPDTQWKTGFSARTIAHSWAAADGFPREVADLIASSGDPRLRSVDPLVAVPEYQVALPGGRRASQSDVFALGRLDDGLAVIVVEGKVVEAFGPTVKEWGGNASPGKKRRLAFLQEQLGLRKVPGAIRYQLLHRTASAVIEAQRFCAREALMIVHSFDQAGARAPSFQDYAAFVALYGKQVAPGRLVTLTERDGVRLSTGWAVGDPRFLSA